jgi:hypothetical protein
MLAASFSSWMVRVLDFAILLYLMPDITGESLLQLVLDDSLLALARPDG